MILGIDPGLATCGWAVIDHCGTPRGLGLLLSERDKTIDEATDRARRIAIQAEQLAEVAQRYNVANVVLEAMSFGGAPAARFHMAISVGLSWGAAAGVARTLGLGLFSIAPKVWQRAVVPSSGKRIRYEAVEAAITIYANRFEPSAIALAQIPKAKRNHAIDGFGVALFATLRPGEIDVVSKRKAAA